MDSILSPRHISILAVDNSEKTYAFGLTEFGLIYVAIVAGIGIFVIVVLLCSTISAKFRRDDPPIATSEIVPFSSFKSFNQWQEEQRPTKSQYNTRTMPYREYLNTEEWSRRKMRALEGADFACALCQSKKSLQVHHRTYDRRGNESPKDLIVLCSECHQRHHNVFDSDLAH